MDKKQTQSKVPHDAIAMLVEDHTKVQKMFKDYEKLTQKNASDEQKGDLASQICTELSVHAQLEEEIFYPAARDAIDAEDLLDEAEVEHASAKELIAQLESMEPGDELYDAKVKVLGEYIAHHVKEEQDEMFPKVKKSDLDLNALGEEMAERKEELKTETAVDEEREKVPARARRSAAGGRR